MGRTVTLLHAADLHLDSPFEGLSAEQAALRRAEQRELLDRIVELAVTKGADVLLLAGDILDSGSAYLETAETICAALSKTGIPVFIAPGNHDWYSAASPWARLRLPGNVHIFKNEAIECVPLPDLGLRVWGAGYGSDSCPPLLSGFEAEKDGDTLDVLVLHADMLTKGSKYCPVTYEELSRSGMDYAALGHIHSFSGANRAGDCAYAWPGCPEGRGFDERGEKGVILARVAVGKTDVEFIPLGGRRYEILDVTLSPERDTLETVLAALPEDTERHVYRLILSGERDGEIDARALAEALSPRFFRLEIKDRSRPRRDLWEKCGEDSLRGLFLTRLREQYDAAATDARREMISRAAACGIRALDNGEDRM